MIYFATIKKGILFSKIKKSLLKKEVEILKYYPRFNTLKLNTDHKLALKDFPELASLEEEKTDFLI